MRRTKAKVIDEFINVVAEFRQVDEELFKLVEEGKVNSGCLFVHLSHHTGAYRWLYGDLTMNWPCRMYGNPRKVTYLSLYMVHLEDMKRELEKAKDFVSRPQHGWVGYTREG